MPAKKTTAKVDQLRAMRERQYDESKNKARQSGEFTNQTTGGRNDPKGNSGRRSKRTKD